MQLKHPQSFCREAEGEREVDIEFKAKVFVSLAFYVNYIDSIITQAWVVFFGVVCLFFFSFTLTQR